MGHGWATLRPATLTLGQDGMWVGPLLAASLVPSFKNYHSLGAKRKSTAIFIYLALVLDFVRLTYFWVLTTH